MKTKLCLIFFAALMLLSCKKVHHYVASGHVKHMYTGENVEGVCVGYFNNCGSPINCTESLIGWATTDAQGNFKIEFDSRSTGNRFETIQLLPFDTTSNMYKFMSNMNDYNGFVWYSADIQLKPSGYITMHVSDSVWDSIGADSVIIQTPYVIELLIRDENVVNQLGFYVEPSQYNTFKWYYVKNGIYSTPLTKSIFVPNYYKDHAHQMTWGTPLFYEIKF
jgi:hypothetical protein